MKMLLIKNRADQQGFSLFEILIAISVLSVGLLGLAGIQMTGMQNNYSAYLRSQATFLAYDLADRMRANSQAAKDGAYLSSFSNATAQTDCLQVSTGHSAPFFHDLNPFSQEKSLETRSS